MFINKVRGRGEQPMWQKFVSKLNNDVFASGGILLDT
jgi:hypothetical protein